jgi:hypothetical protein
MTAGERVRSHAERAALMNSHKPCFFLFFVIPAKAGIQFFQGVLDPGVRRGDGLERLLASSSALLPQI